MNGYGIAPGLVVEDLKLEDLERALDRLPNLKTVQFCGVYGDPVAAKNLNEQIDMVLDRGVTKIQIHTNGGLRKESWWYRLAEQLSSLPDHFVEFAIDGLEDTNHLYRQGVNWKKLIGNVRAFISAGGNAHWQFIPFAHNQHQITQAMALSQELGFNRFHFLKNARYSPDPRHYRTNKSINIKPWSRDKQFNKLEYEEKEVVEKSNCMHLDYPSVYLSARGLLTPCCYIRDMRVEDVDIKKTIDDKDYMPVCLRNCGSKKNS